MKSVAQGAKCNCGQKSNFQSLRINVLYLDTQCNRYKNVHWDVLYNFLRKIMKNNEKFSKN